MGAGRKNDDLPSYQFLLQFYLKHSEHMLSCKQYKRQKNGEKELEANKPQFSDEDYFTAYKGGHMLFLVSIATTV